MDWCDNRCSDKATRFWQIASMVVEEGGKKPAQSICVNSAAMKRCAAGQTATEIMAMERVVEKKAHRGKVWKVFGCERFLGGMSEYFTLKRAGARKNRADAAREKQEGKQGQWQQESPFKEVLEQVKRSADADCAPQTMRSAHLAMKHGNWEDFKEEQGRKESFVRREVYRTGDPEKKH